MKTHRTLLISILLNGLMLAWIVSLPRMRPRQPNARSNPSAIAPTTAGSAALKPLHPSAAQSSNPPLHTGTFDWRQVESEDYKQYIANLRAIGCPEKTIKEVIAADVNDLFASRRASVLRTNRYEYWRAHPELPDQEQQQRLLELAAEKADTMTALGVESFDLADPLADFYRYQIEATERAMDFLPETKRQRARELRAQQLRLMSAAGADSPNLAEIGEKAESEIKGLLTPEELYEYDLRTSIPAMQLRGVLNDLAPTEPEFRTIYETWNNLQAKPAGSAEYREAQQSSEVTLRQLLGSNRFEFFLQGVKSLGYVR